MLGYSQLRLGKNSDALLTYVRLASRYPKSAEALYGLSSAQSANGSFAAAQLSLRRALGLRPKFPEAIYALAALQLRSGKIADARKLVGDAQKLLPGSAVGLVIAGDAAMAEKRNEQAVRAYEAAFAMDRTDAILMKLHGALRAAGKTAAADALAADWLAKHPDDVPMRYFVADAAIRGENFPLAAEQYEYALRKQPDKLALLHNLGWVYERMKDPRALKLAEKAYEIAPTSPGVMHDLGRLLIESGNAQRAVKLLEQARVLAPEAQLIRYQLAKGYAMTGDNAAARLELEQLLRGQSEFAGRTEAAELLKKLRN